MTQSGEKRQPRLMTLRQASEFLGYHPNTLRKWDKSGYLKAVRVGTRKDRRYLREDIFNLLKKQKG